MTDLTFVIPVGPYHTEIVGEALASVHAQTIPCNAIVIEDTEGAGAGWARNRGLERVTTDYVAFLDADDVIDPVFAQVCLGILAQVAQPHRYIYTDWRGAHQAVYKAPEPCDAWRDGTFHLITTVLPVDRVRLIGGFDEAMSGVEDTDFYVRLRLSGVCGIHVNAPLVLYRDGGQRSIAARANGQEEAVKLYMSNRYGRMEFMGCCGDPTPGPTGPDNEPQPGDVLVQAQWQGNRVERGRATGRLYPRTSHPKLLYVAATDVDAAPQHWRRVSAPVQASNGVVLQPQYQPVSNWQDVVGALFGGSQPEPAAQPVEYRPHTAGKTKKAVIEQAQAKSQSQEWTRVEGDLE